MTLLCCSSPTQCVTSIAVGHALHEVVWSKPTTLGRAHHDVYEHPWTYFGGPRTYCSLISPGSHCRGQSGVEMQGVGRPKGRREVIV